MSDIINEYRYNEDEAKLLVPDINVAEFSDEPPTPVAPQPAFASINPDGTVNSVGQMQGSDLTQTPIAKLQEIDYSNIEQTTNQRIQEQTQQQAESMQTANDAAASQLQQSFDPTLTMPAFDDTYDFNASNAQFESFYKERKQRINEVQLTPNLSTADTQESEPSWLDRGLAAINYGSNVLQGTSYDFMSRENKAQPVLDLYKDKLPDFGAPVRNLFSGIGGAIDKERAKPGFNWADMVPSVKFDSERNYAYDAMRGNDVTVFGTDIGDVGKAGKSPIAVINPEFDPKVELKHKTRENADGSVTTTLEDTRSWQKKFTDGAKNPTRWAAGFSDLGLGIFSVSVFQKSAAVTVGKVVGAASKSAKAAKVAQTATNIVIDPAGEALGYVGGKLVSGIKTRIQKGQATVLQPKPVSPTASQTNATTVIQTPAVSATKAPTTIPVSLVNVPLFNKTSIVKGDVIETLAGSAKAVSVDADRGVVILDYGDFTDSVPFENITSVNGRLPFEFVVASPPKGGASLPATTPKKRATIPLSGGEKRPTTSVRNVQPEAKTSVQVFTRTQPSITPATTIRTYPPTVIQTDVPGVVTSAKSQYTFLKQQQAIAETQPLKGDSLGADYKKPIEDLPNSGVDYDSELSALENVRDLPDDIPEVDVRVFTGAMTYEDLSSVVSQQVPGTQIDVGALSQVPRSTEDIIALANVLGLETPDVPLPKHALVSYLTEQTTDSVNVSSVISEYGVPVPTETLSQATDIRIKVQDEVPFKQPDAGVVIRQEPQTTNKVGDLTDTEQEAVYAILEKNVGADAADELFSNYDISTHKSLSEALEASGIDKDIVYRNLFEESNQIQKNVEELEKTTNTSSKSEIDAVNKRAAELKVDASAAYALDSFEGVEVSKYKTFNVYHSKYTDAAEVNKLIERAEAYLKSVNADDEFDTGIVLILDSYENPLSPSKALRESKDMMGFSDGPAREEFNGFAISDKNFPYIYFSDISRASSGSVVHEYAHLLDLLGSPDDLAPFSQRYFKNLTERTGEYPSTQYGRTNEKEDLAEAFADYVINPQKFKKRYPQRAPLIEKLIKENRVKRIEKQLPIELRSGDYDTAVGLVKKQIDVADAGSLTQTIRQNLEKVSENLDVSTNRTLETVDVGRKYDPDLKFEPLVGGQSSSDLYRSVDGKVYRKTKLEPQEPRRVSEEVALRDLQETGVVPRLLDETDAHFDTEAVQGTPLTRFAETASKEDLDRVLDNVVAATEKLKKAGYLHTDLHGGNVIVEPDLNVKLIDFQDSLSLKHSFKGDEEKFLNESVNVHPSKKTWKFLLEDELEAGTQFTADQKADVWLHGTRVDLPDSFDAIAGGKRAEYGSGFYLTTNADAAQSYALADVSPNLPNGSGRTYDQPSVYSYKLSPDAYILDASYIPSDLSPFKAAGVNVKPGSTLKQAYEALDKYIVKNNLSETQAHAAYTKVNRTLQSKYVSGIRDGETLVLFDTNAAKKLYKQPIKASDDVLEAAAHRHNVDSRRAALNPNNIQAQIDFEESAVRLQAEMKGKLETDLEVAETNQRNAITKLLDEQERIELETTRRIELTETERGQVRMERVQKEFDKLTDPDSNLDICQP